MARRVFEEADDALGDPSFAAVFRRPGSRSQADAKHPAGAADRFDGGFRGRCARNAVGARLRSRATAWASTRRWWPPGAWRFADAVRLVRNRGRYMQEAVPPGVGAMAALLQPARRKLDSRTSGRGCPRREIVSAANLNSPDQVVIAGHAGAVNRAIELAKAAGARRAVLLPVSAPFHCALMHARPGAPARRPGRHRSSATS